MSKKILMLEGFIRKRGNTAELFNKTKSELLKSGATVDVVDLCKLENRYSGCSSCYGCQPMKFKCVVPDATAEVINRIPAYDVMIFAFPVYMFGIPSQVKQFIDRMMAMASSDENEVMHSPVANMKTGFIITSGGDANDSGLEAIKLQLKYLYSYCGAPDLKYYYRDYCVAPINEPAAEEKLAEAKSFADSLLK